MSSIRLLAQVAHNKAQASGDDSSGGAAAQHQILAASRRESVDATRAALQLHLLWVPTPQLVSA